MIGQGAAREAGGARTVRSCCLIGQRSTDKTDTSETTRATPRDASRSAQAHGALSPRLPSDEGSDHPPRGALPNRGACCLLRSRAAARMSVPAHQFTGSNVSGSLSPTTFAISQTMNQISVNGSASFGPPEHTKSESASPRACGTARRKTRARSVSEAVRSAAASRCGVRGRRDAIAAGDPVPAERRHPYVERLRDHPAPATDEFGARDRSVR